MSLADALILKLWGMVFGDKEVTVPQIMELMTGLPISVTGQFLQRVALLAKQGYIRQKPDNIYQMKVSD